MSQTEHYDVLILGSGGGGKLTAWHNGRSGRRTAVVERKWIGEFLPKHLRAYRARMKFIARRRRIRTLRRWSSA